MSDVERRYHEDWLGRVQPIEGLVFSVPVLAEAKVMFRRGRAHQARFEALCQPAASKDGAYIIRDLESLLFELLEFKPAQFDIGDAMLEGTSVYVEEGEDTLRPTMALRTGEGDTPAERYGMLVWAIPEDYKLDSKEKHTSAWDYAPAGKLARMLTATGVPIGLLFNGRVTRLIYCPRGASLGAITFVTDHMRAVDGRPILDAFCSLLSAPRWFVVPEDKRLPALLKQSRERQQDVTTALAEQVFEALTILLRGVEEAAERDGDEALREALAQEEQDVVYTGLLTALLRMVFVLYAEDRGLLHTGDPIYGHIGLLPLYEQLVVDAGDFPDTMEQRFGAWPRVLTLFRAIYFGARFDDGEGDGFYLPPRHGDLFNPHTFGFLEGWGTAGAAPTSPKDRALLRVPTISDGTLYQVLEKLLILDGQRLSYRSLEVEQIGSVYEALMGYRVERVSATSVCLKPQRVWVSLEQLREKTKAARAKWLKELGLSKAQAKKIETTVLAAADDREALAALRKYAFRGLPAVAGGRLVIQPGEERRRTSSHYTPRSLSEPIVERTLEPLLRSMGPKPSSEQLLSLTICDPAMGSGAFLVAACRTLAKHVEKAWEREGVLDERTAEHGDPRVPAKRLVAQRCLYGVDKNPLAVDLAKLSLWLETLSAEQPFTFLDHALKCGDSLVGLFLPQVRAFDWSAPVRSAEDSDTKPKQLGLFESLIIRQVEKARLARDKLLQLAGQERREADLCERKEDLHREAEAAIERVRIIADVAIGAFFDHAKDKQRKTELKRRRALVEMWLQQGEDARLPVELKQLRERARERRPFHWPLEFPEVFWNRRRDPLAPESETPGWLDAVVGNPPFLGGRRISGSFGDEYADWLHNLHQASKNGDLSAHFLRRAATLLAEHGTVGLVTTNTICQGDTRELGLSPLIQQGWRIFFATTSMEWPGVAAVSISIVQLALGSPCTAVITQHLDNEEVDNINSRLRPKPERPPPVKLHANARKSFQGSVIVGMAGFTLSKEERRQWIEQEPENAVRIFPFLGGDEVNSDPRQEHSRYIINFGSMSLTEAEMWPDLIGVIRTKVKPLRDKVKREAHRKRWWQYGDKRPELYRSIAMLPRCLVNGRVAKHLIFSFQPTTRVFSDQLYVYPFTQFSHFAILQSRVHEHWAWLLSSSMRNAGIRYTPSDCFETFPFPEDKHLDPAGPLEAAGKALYEARAAYMTDTDRGLTKTYNRLKDPNEVHPRLQQLRELHIAMDRAVLAAYGWADLTPPPFTDPQTDEEKAVRQEFEDEVIDRLFALNAKRAAAEKRLGKKRATGKKRASSKKRATSKKRTKTR